MPVWILDRTDAPPITISVLFALNTVLVVLFQMPVSRRAENVREAGRLQVLAGVAMAVSCGCFTISGVVHGWQAVGWLLLAIVVLTLGEVMNNAGGWLLSLSLAPPSRRGRYLAVFNLGLAAERVAGPILVTNVLLRWSDVGWAASAGVFVFAGMMSERVVMRAQTPAPAVRPAGEKLPS
jgi:MFS family permease